MFWPDALRRRPARCKNNQNVLTLLPRSRQRKIPRRWAVRSNRVPISVPYIDPYKSRRKAHRCRKLFRKLNCRRRILHRRLPRRRHNLAGCFCAISHRHPPQEVRIEAIKTVGNCFSPSFKTPFFHLPITKAIGRMIINHAHRLHMGVDDG